MKLLIQYHTQQLQEVVFVLMSLSSTSTRTLYQVQTFSQVQYSLHAANSDAKDQLKIVKMYKSVIWC